MFSQGSVWYRYSVSGCSISQKFWITVLLQRLQYGTGINTWIQIRLLNTVPPTDPDSAAQMNTGIRICTLVLKDEKFKLDFDF
jgi:hypothetical protein